MLPDAGDIAWVELDLVRGTEQLGRRPALVLTGTAYHQRSLRSVVCPITSAIRPWALDVPLPRSLRTRGVVLVDQVRAIDREARLFRIVERVSDEFLDEVRTGVAQLIGLRLP